MITHILWDMDNTLLDFGKSERYAVRRALEEAGVPPMEETVALYSSINDACWKRLERGELTRQKLYTERFRLLFEALGIKKDCREIAAAYPVYLGQSAYIVPGSYELCRSLQGRYRQYIVTNGNASTSGHRLRLSGFDRLMDGCFISEEIGADKPSPVFFQRCFACMPGACREQTVIVGDSLTSDMQGGRNAGIRCVWYNPQGKPASDKGLFDTQIHDLHELPVWLETQ